MARILSRLVGHSETLTPLLNAVAQGKIAATLLFAGPAGVGKRLAAMGLAQVLVCERRSPEDSQACGECGSCLRLEKGQSESLLVVEPEGAGIKAEQARDILQFITLQKLGRARVVIIDQAHLLNPQAGNALLKSLEEPPSGTYFILITSLAAAVLSTIRSRSQLVRFRPLTVSELGQVLGPEADPWVLEGAHGSLEIARRMEESRDEFLQLEVAATNFLLAAGHGLPLVEISKLKDLIKDKPSQAFLTTFVQSVVRDALRLQAGLPPADSRRTAKAAQTLSGFAPEAVRALADFSLELEQDFARNVDRTLAMENFAIRLREGAHEVPK
jgi:DNA polymerase-3 subunit delta'